MKQELNENDLKMTDDIYKLILKLLKQQVDIKHIQNITGASIEKILKIKYTAL